jgi:tellurite resistance protein TerC
MGIHFTFWVIFSVLFITVFSIDLFFTGHRIGEIKLKAAISWTIVWITTALLFSIFIHFYFPDGIEKAAEYIAAYLVEYSLSVDNLFVFIMIFSVMGITADNQPRILKWGIIGAVIFRVIFIIAGISLLKEFQFVIYIFGAILIYTAFKMLTSKDEKIEPGKNVFVKLASKIFKVKTDVKSHNFFIRENNKTYATLAFITLVLIESTDVLFAVDSIPAVLAITRDSLIAITSNLFAILGLRSLFFALSGILNLFRYLKYGIAVILIFVGIKMLLSYYIHIPVHLSLGVILFCLLVSILASIIKKGTKKTGS